MSQGVIVSVFPNRRTLTRALDYLKENGVVDVRRAAIVAKATSGEVTILDDDLTPHEGGIAGGTLGAAMAAIGVVQLGALSLPGVGIVIALGASALVGGLLGGLTGRFAAALLDFGYHNEQILGLSQMLEANKPALVLEIDEAETGLHILRDVLKQFRATLIEPLHKAGLNPPADVE